MPRLRRFRKDVEKKAGAVHMPVVQHDIPRVRPPVPGSEAGQEFNGMIWQTKNNKNKDEECRDKKTAQNKLQTIFQIQ